MFRDMGLVVSNHAEGSIQSAEKRARVEGVQTNPIPLWQLCEPAGVEKVRMPDDVTKL